ncbi:nickel transporter [Variovorax paradoxus]|uniref:nickel/cobalt efflux protein RcnA n=1 Tax=Variovorax TaxID=34072 RepID=UPI0006E59771|nr:nickel/cobalt efflux protein RcnA [Variovorax boronicumulans]KPU89799.1 nickel transporter [Variovorax paradoxus]KPV01751.1 nickel transporter [Variovorax paradoxus]KPV04103.1 nickel transporter [Variovorax paradoxus]KPV17928.1 nickel transporter [Variovorax paradoxus]KPV27765.1 nickel transporter [Variovorax paradoxus]
MENFAQLLQAGNAWVFIPSAILLGALHGLEPGHSKTMMAAFIVAVRGTVGQAVLLGLAATLSHTAVVWAVAMGGLYLGRNWSAEETEPYFQVASAVLIIAIALWMLWRTYREQQRERIETDHDHHGHGEEKRRIDTGHGIVDLEVFEDGVSPRFRVRFEGHDTVPQGQTVAIDTERAGGERQAFVLANKGSYLESVDEIPEPHEFTVRLSIAHGGHAHSFDVEFVEHGQGHDHEGHGLDVSDPGFQDAHERAHANDIKRRFASRNVTTGQIIGFGLTGGLIPCPAAITVLLLCLQLKRFTLGASLVLCFSIGLAITMVAAGVVAALGMKHASKRFSNFGAFARRAPYVSSALIILVGLYVGYHGIQSLHAAGVV